MTKLPRNDAGLREDGAEKWSVASGFPHTAESSAAWMDSAAMFSRNADFYRGIVVQIGEMFGDAAKTNDDGSLQDSVLALKVPGLVATVLTKQPASQELSAAGVVGDMHQAIYGEPGMPKEITPLSWLRSMLDACDTQEAVKSLGGDDPEAWGEMCGEVRAMVSALDRLTLTPAAPKTPDAGVGGARIAQALSTADWSGASIGNKALISAAIAALAQPAPVDEDETGVREALAWYGEQARLARLIHSEGDSGRHALSDDGGKRAAAALAPQPPKAETLAGVGDDEAFVKWFGKTSLGQGDRGFAASCFYAGRQSALCTTTNGGQA